MKKEGIERLVRSGSLRIRQPDTERVKSILKSSEMNAKVIKKISLSEESATIIFKETYECVKQLGDAKWWLMGYEPVTHEASLEILKDFEIREKIRLNHMDRFRKIRNDATYRGYIVSVSQAAEILDFWDKCGKEILQTLVKKIKK